MNPLSRIWLAALFGSLALAGCAPNEGAAPAEKQYSIQGKVTAWDAIKPSIRLDHEAIPELMGAMVMDFSVADPKLLDGLKI